MQPPCGGCLPGGWPTLPTGMQTGPGLWSSGREAIRQLHPSVLSRMVCPEANLFSPSQFSSHGLSLHHCSLRPWATPPLALQLPLLPATDCNHIFLKIINKIMSHFAYKLTRASITSRIKSRLLTVASQVGICLPLWLHCLSLHLAPIIVAGFFFPWRKSSIFPPQDLCTYSCLAGILFGEDRMWYSRHSRCSIKFCRTESNFLIFFSLHEARKC